LEENLLSREDDFARECLIRDRYAERLADFRPRERLLRTENTLAGSRVRADMRTVDNADVLRIWEFKIAASYAGLGQILTYLALERRATDFKRDVRGVLAAFIIQPEIRFAVAVLNLGIELVVLPPTLRLAGAVLTTSGPTPVPDIPNLAQLALPQPGKDS
jgi:hypothetical protein